MSVQQAKFVLEVEADKFTQDLQEDCDIIGLKFVEENFELLKKILPQIKKPLMLRGPVELLKAVDRSCIYAFAQENDYKKIVPEILKGKHTLVIRTPIDINLAKEMNILVHDMGLPMDKIVIDTDIGGLGYGLEYGYSMIEKIKLEGHNGDEYLNLPIISFVVEETLKTKEAKSGLASMYEVSSAAAVLAAGADYIVMNTPEALQTMKGLMQ